MESLKQQHVAVSADSEFLFLAHLLLRVNYKRKFNKCSGQRSNKGSSADIINYLFGIHIPFLPHYQNPDSCRGQQCVQLKPLSASQGQQGNSVPDSEM